MAPEPRPHSSANVEVITPAVAEQPWNRYVRAHYPDLTVELGDADRLEVEVTAPPRQRPAFRGRFENNLSRKGVFDLRPDRSSNDRSVSVSRTDVIGKTTLTYTLGALGPLEMDLIAWVMGQWQRGHDQIGFNLREVGRALGVAWKGQLGTAIKEGLLRVKATTITGRVWDAEQKKHTTASFNIFDLVKIVEDRSSENGPATRPATVSVVLSDWVTKQLRAGQYSDFDWELYRGRLKSSFARRLYLLLESHEGEGSGTTLRIKIDGALSSSLGTDDGIKNPSRFRQRLLKHGREICDAIPYYMDVAIRAGSRQAEYFLEVRRSCDWRSDRVQRRKHSLNQSVA